MRLLTDAKNDLSNFMEQYENTSIEMGNMQRKLEKLQLKQDKLKPELEILVVTMLDAIRNTMNAFGDEGGEDQEDEGEEEEEEVAPNPYFAQQPRYI